VFITEKKARIIRVKAIRSAVFFIKYSPPSLIRCVNHRFNIISKCLLCVNNIRIIIHPSAISGQAGSHLGRCCREAALLVAAGGKRDEG